MAISPNVPGPGSSPLVSIVIPIYNGIPYILDTIESVRRQSYPTWELIICDNASKDDTVIVVQKDLEERPDPRIRLILHQEHLPMAECWNRALTYAQGDFIKLLPSDDILLPRCLEVQVGLLQEHTDVGLTSSSKDIINSKGERLFSRRPLPEGTYDWANLGPRSLCAVTNLIGEPAGILFRKELLATCGDYDGRFKYFVDVDLTLRFLKAANLFVKGETLYQFRIHGASASAASRSISVREYLQLLDKHDDVLHFSKRPLARRYYEMKAHLVTLARSVVFWMNRNSP